MRRTIAAALGTGLLMAGSPAVAGAEEPTEKMRKAYLRLYERAEKLGADPGRNIVEDGVLRRGQDGETRDATRREVRRSLGVLRRMTAPAAPAPAGAGGGLVAIAASESGGDPTAVSAGGTYRGKYQFDMQTWQSVGGTGDPAAAPEAEQDARAQALMAQRGTAPWPVCGP